MRTPTALIRLGWACALVTVSLPAAAQQPPPVDASKLPRLEYNEPIWCLTDAQGRPVRVQVRQDASGKPVYLVAPGLDENGKELHRASTCSIAPPEVTLAGLRARGVRMLPAIAEAPPGWYRDERGRVFQIHFDMYKRFYLGGGWTPVWDPQQPAHDYQRARFEIGFVSSWVTPESRMRHTIRAVEGDVVLDDLQMRGQLFSYELNHASTQPLLRLTTFFGTPRRYDAHMDVGFGLRTLGVQMRTHRDRDLSDLEYGELHANWALWQSADLLNHVQLSAGVGGGQINDTLGQNRQYKYVLPDAALEFRFVVDRAGFHTLGANAHGSLPVFVTGHPAGTMRRRVGGGVAYEVIFLAINDQPLSLRLEGNLDYRTDLPERAPKWETTALSGLRFSFWAPGRTDERIPRAGGGGMIAGSKGIP
jgi:hypothetical protein